MTDNDDLGALRSVLDELLDLARAHPDMASAILRLLRATRDVVVEGWLKHEAA